MSVIYLPNEINIHCVLSKNQLATRMVAYIYYKRPQYSPLVALFWVITKSLTNPTFGPIARLSVLASDTISIMEFHLKINSE